MIASSCLIYLLPKSINNPLGRIRDVYSDNEVEMKDMQKEPENVVISVNPETAKQPEEGVIVREKKELAAEATPSADEVTVLDTSIPPVAQPYASDKNESTQKILSESSVPSNVAN